MKNFLYVFFITITLITSVANTKVVCTKYKAFTHRLNGKPVDVTSSILPKYSDKISCESQCRKTSNCLQTSSNISSQIAPLVTYYTEAQKNKLLSLVGNKQIDSLRVDSMSGSNNYRGIKDLNGSMFVFPAGTPPLNGKLSKTIYSSNGLTLRTYKFFKYNYSQELVLTGNTITHTDRNNINSKVNSLINQGNKIVGVVIDSYKLMFPSHLSKNSFVWNDTTSEKVLFSNGDFNVVLKTDIQNINHKYSLKFKVAGAQRSAFVSSTTHTLKLLYKKLDTSAAVYGMTADINGVHYEQSDRWVSNSFGSFIQDQALGFLVTFNISGFTCPLFGGNTDLGGDIALNMFSTNAKCLNQCYKQNSCTPWTNNPKCRPTSYQPSHPISDYTGKTIFTKYDISWDCNTSIKKQGACLQYTTNAIDYNASFKVGGFGWKSKSFASPDQAMASVMGLEQFQHLWSGWNGMCESGIKMDNSWMSDPMQLLSLCMMAYTGALNSTAYGTAAHSAAQSVQSSFDAAGNAISSAFTGGSSSSAVNQLNSGSKLLSDGGSLGGVTPTVPASATNTSFLSTHIVDATTYSTAVTYGSALMDAAQMVMAALSPPTDNDLALADDFMKTQMGGNPKTIAAVNYAQCMASIGLSFPNLVAYSVDSNSTSSVLKKPWEHPISMTVDQAAHLMAATSSNYVRNAYIMINKRDSSGVAKFIALTSSAYTQAGQVICGSGIARAINIRSQQASSPKGGLNGQAMATQAVSTALSYLPPPYNLVASIIFKVLTSISNGDACTDKKLAMKWGLQQYKTNKSIRFKQCHYISSKCVAKFLKIKCIRDEYDYCCYDQEMSRIFVEGAKQELGTPWKIGQCSDIKLSDLKNISFRKCGDNEQPKRDKCFPQSSWNELNGAIKKSAGKGFDAKSLTKTAIDSMPVREDPWGHTIGN